MDDSSTRREELIVAALAGELTGDDEREFAALSAADPTMLADLEEIRGTADLISQSGIRWQETLASPDLGERIVAAASPPTVHSLDLRRSHRDRQRRRFRPLIAAATIALILGGAVGGQGVRALFDRSVDGPPGTLGATEQVSFAKAPAGTEIKAALVAHTWGTETILDIDGFKPGETFEVILVDREGRSVGSGTFYGSKVTVSCRMNAAIMRADIKAVQIKGENGKPITAALPAVVS